ncbi:MAG: DUF2149 domain-containing protein [Planctomycetota bacterium]
MKYFRKKRQYTGTNEARRTAETEHDPLSGVANLFDVGLVFIVGLLVSLFSAYHLQDLMSEESNMTITKQKPDGELEIVKKKGEKVEMQRVTRQEAGGTGERLGTAYRLDDGTVVYVPDVGEGQSR